MRMLFRFCFLLLLVSPLHAQEYLPTHDSIASHPLPQWYQDAKFGIMVTYGLPSVPGWAPLFDPTGKIFTKEFFFNNPYSEWYLNSMQIPGSPTNLYHAKTYGANYAYDNFIPEFNKESQFLNPTDWATLFKTAGAKYVVLVTKHHDGFVLWPTHIINPYKSNYVATRDIVGDVTKAVRAQGLRMGLYYSGGYDWSWGDKQFPGPIVDTFTSLAKIQQSQSYADYMTAQYHELISWYHPDILWNDIALPANVNKWQLFADYYNAVPEGVVNNRWSQTPEEFASTLGQPSDATVDKQRTYDWFDYYSPEYLPHYDLTRNKWEADHGPGYAFAYNRNEFDSPAHFKTADELIADLADIVSKNGNLILAIGPEADGTIPELDRKLLIDLGAWLQLNGEAIYKTRPWWFAEDTANFGTIPIRYTQNKTTNSLYVILLKNPQGQDVLLSHLLFNKQTKISILNGKNAIPVAWYNMGNSILVSLKANKLIPNEHPLVLKISPIPMFSKN